MGNDNHLKFMVIYRYFEEIFFTMKYCVKSNRDTYSFRFVSFHIFRCLINSYEVLLQRSGWMAREKGLGERSVERSQGLGSMEGGVSAHPCHRWL